MPGFGWLHLTDLHVAGAGGFRTLWPNVEEQLLDDLAKLHARSGPWDLVLFTGDLTQRGSAAEFQALDGLLDLIWQHLRGLGSDPALFAVPGNHDLVRPDPRRPEVRLLARWEDHADVREELWTDSTSPYRRLIQEAFAPFTAWNAAAHLRRPAELQTGLLPGDASAALEKDGLRLGLLGLNTSFLQLGDGPWEGRLALDPRQFHGATGGDGPRWVRGCDLALICSHQGPGWLNPDSQTALNGEIAIPGRFLAHLYGHMHEASSASLAVGGAAAWRRWQGTSLFGLEGWGAGTERRHGYAAGRLDIDSAGRASLRLWPRAGYRHQAGFWQIGPDTSYVLEDDGGTPAEVVPLRRRPRPQLPDMSFLEVTTQPIPEPPLPEAECLQLLELSERMHEDEVEKVSRQMARGEYVALLAPTGFRLGLAVRALAEVLNRQRSVVAFRVTQMAIAETLDDWMDFLLRELGARVPGLSVTPRGNRLLALLYALQDASRLLQERGSRLHILVDPVESFSGEHRQRLVRVLQVMAQLSEERTNDPALEVIGVAMAGGEELQAILAGRVAVSADLSPVRASTQTVLGPVSAPEGASAAVRGVVEAVGGHPELLRWAANRGGRVGGRPEDELPFLGEQVARFRQGRYREQLGRLLAGEAAAWRDPDPALRWSGWLRLSDRPGWLGRSLEDLARRTVAT